MIYANFLYFYEGLFKNKTPIRVWMGVIVWVIIISRGRRGHRISVHHARYRGYYR